MDGLVHETYLYSYEAQDQFRVRMPTRYNVAELNGKYVPYIAQVVVKKLKERNPVIK